MNQTRIINNTKVIFKEDPHIYETEDGQCLTSVSAFLLKHKEPFDSNMISMRVAKRDGREQYEVLAEWNRKKEASLLLGNYIHETLYLGLLNPEAVQDKMMLSIIEQVKTFLPEGYEIFREQMLADIKNRIAGTADLVLVKDKECIIFDYKTNNLSKSGYNNFKAPLQYLEQNKINEYRLQLSLYKHLKELEGVKVVGLNILNILNGKVEKIGLDPLDEEVKMIIK